MAPVEGREAARRGSRRRWLGGTVAEGKEGFRWPLGGCGRKLESRGGGEATAGSSESSVSGPAPAAPPGYVVMARGYGARWLLGRGLSQRRPLA